MDNHKFSKTENPANSKAELFVLPPELLAQLGINLSNIQQSEEQPVATSLTQGTSQNFDNSHVNSDTSSIIETANLMKESVFLSPTFLQTASNVVPDKEEPIIDNSIKINNAIPVVSVIVPYSCNTEMEVCDKTTPELLHDSIVISHHDVVLNQINNVDGFESIKEYQVENRNGNLILTDVPNPNIAAYKSKHAVEEHLDEDHPDEAYLSDCSNSYSRTSLDKMNSDGNGQKLHETSELPVVSRDPSPMNNNTLLQGNNTLLIPNNMDFIATKQVICNDSVTVIRTGEESNLVESQINIEQQEILLSSVNEKIATEKTQKIVSDCSAKKMSASDQREKELNFTQTDDNAYVKPTTQNNISFNHTSIILDEYDYEENLEKTSEYESNVQENIKCSQSDVQKIVENNENNNLINQEDLSGMIIEKSNCEKNTEDTNKLSETKNTCLDKVQEIAAYLSHIANERKKSFRIRNSNKETKNSLIKSKLCIQGVEKPGGNQIIQNDEIKCSKITKTYQRKIRTRKTPKFITMPDEIMNTDIYQLPNISDLNGIKVALKSETEFCICHDFGMLAYYDCEMLCEHIHFCTQKNSICDLEILFSIYNEDNIIVKQSVDFIKDDHQNEHNDNEEGNLCWHFINIKRNEPKKSESVSDSKVSEKASRIISKRKSEINDFTLSSKKIQMKTDKGGTHKDNINRKRSCEAKDQLNESNINKKNKVVNRCISEKEYELHKTNTGKAVAVDVEITVTPKRKSIIEKLDATDFPKRTSKTKSSLNTDSKDIKSSTIIICDKPVKLHHQSTTELSAVTKNSNKSSSKLSTTIKPAYKHPSTATSTKSKKMSIDSNITESASKTPKNLNTENNKTATSTNKSSELKTDSSNLSMNSAKSDESAKFTKTKENVVIDKRFMDNSVFTKANNFDCNVTKSSRKSNTASLKKNVTQLLKTKNISPDLKAIVAPTKETTENSNLPENTEAFDMNNSVPLKKITEEEAKSTSIISSVLPISVVKDEKEEILKSSESKSTSTTNKKVAASSKETTENSDSPKVIKAVNVNISASLSGPTKQETKTISKSISSVLPVLKDCKKKVKLKSSELVSTSSTNTKSCNIQSDMPTETGNSHNSILTKSKEILDNTNNLNVSLPPEERAIIKKDILSSPTSNKTMLKLKPDKRTEPEATSKLSWKSRNTEMDETQSTKISLNTVHTPLKEPKIDNDAERSYRNKKKIYKDGPKDTCALLTSKSTESLSETTDIEILNSTTMEEVIDTENYTIVIEIEGSVLLDNYKKCGVCEKIVEDSDWIEHISKEHDYCAWRASEPALDLENEVAVRKHLQAIGNQNDGLKCSKCSLVRKFAKAYLRHIKDCTGNEKDANASAVSIDMDTTQEHDSDDSPLASISSNKSRRKRKAADSQPPSVTCGVCNQSVDGNEWIEHIRLQHKYLARKVEEEPLDVNNEDEVKSHLNYISKYYGGLLCSKCGSKWSYVKKYLIHESLCDGASHKLTPHKRKPKETIELSATVTCGICNLDVEGKNWIKHIQVAHEYLAWIKGEKPLDLENQDEVKEHLTKVVNMAGELVCKKCGAARVFARAYMQHVNACTNSGFEMQITQPVSVDSGKFECAVCHETGNIKQWKDHTMKKHYNVAWMAGELPINVRNFYAVEKLLKEYQKKCNLVCHNCRASRTSCYGFYAHILTCGKSGDEVEALHNVCDICNSKYLCVYRNQHMASHRDQEQRREMREWKAQKAAEEALRVDPVEEQPMGKRKAAQKAKKVIEKYTLKGKPICACGAAFDNADEMAQHECDQKKKADDGNESDESVKLEPESGAESESGDTDIDSTVSDCEEEDQKKKKKRQRLGEGSTKITRMSYRVSNYNHYLIQSYKDFSNLHYTSSNLFNEWRNSEYEVVPSTETTKYLPALTESCKVRFGSESEDWTTYKRFEAKKVKGYSLFTGGTIQCMSWVPPNVEDETLSNYLAVVAHKGSDVPRYGPSEIPEHPALLQIWDFKQFNFMPTCSLAIALDSGIVWAMDWCPSGARDRIPTDCSEDKLTEYRLGLLAVACSNGSCYILAVPCPPVANEGEFVMYKLKPVAELRLTTSPERRAYQATSIKWSEQKGHETIIVGYSDGTTAFYDLDTESPFLKSIDNGVTIFYPFQDKQSENSSVTAVGMFPTADSSRPLGSFFSTSVTGGTLSAWRGAPAVRCHAAVGAAYASAYWPAVMLSGDAPFMKSVTELEWWGGGRRLGASRAGCACARCGRACAAAAPAIRLLRCHPCYPEVKKLIIATLLMVPIGQKKKRKANDDLSMVVEPLTYEDAVEKYGLELNLVSKKEQAAALQLCNDNEFFPERFPLSDIVAVAFCPSFRFHDKLAVGTHSGILFVINT